MSGPLSGVGQQVPLSQTFQPGGNEQTRAVRQQEQEQRKDEVQVRGASLSQTQNSERTTENGSTQADFSFKSANNNEGSADQRRGSLVNMVV